MISQVIQCKQLSRKHQTFHGFITRDPEDPSWNVYIAEAEIASVDQIKRKKIAPARIIEGNIINTSLSRLEYRCIYLCLHSSCILEGTHSKIKHRCGKDSSSLTE